VRSFEEAVLFSADTWSFATASSMSRLLGDRVRAFPKGEGDGYPGLAILALALAGVGWGVRRAAARAQPARDTAAERRRLIVLSALLAMVALALLVLFVAGRIPLIGGPWASSHVLLLAAGVLIGALAWTSPAGRRFLGSPRGSMLGFAAAGALLSALLALGPSILAAGEPIGYGPYLGFFHLPGADGVRVPARFFMLMTMFLAILAGYGAAVLLAGRRRLGAVVVAAASVVMLTESWMAPMPVSVPLAPARGFRATPDRLETGATLSPIYRRLRDEPGNVVLIEFPYGDLRHDILATYYAGYHRKKLINGFSGFFPEVYLWRANFLSGIPFDLDAAATALRASGATHAIVHENAFRGGRGREVSDWLRSIGAQPIVTHGSDLLFSLKPAR
jgi:hypothetical protein